MFAELFTPIQVGNLTLKNRIGMSALTRDRAKDSYPTDLMREYYVQRARGGAGLIVTEGILITRQGAEWEHAPGIWDADHVAGWKNIVDAVHAEGGYIYAQLSHLGRLAHPDAPQQKLARTPVYGPSAISARDGKFRFLPGQPGYVTPKAIEDPWTIIKQFKHAALNAKEAGFDGVELHGASGYLINQFLDNTANHRTDQWGGSVENRARFPLEVLKVLVEVFGRNVGIKLGPAGGKNDVGMPLQDALDTYRYFISQADKLSLAYVVLVRYNPASDVVIDGQKRATPHDILASYRPYVKKARLFLNSGITPAEGEELVSSGIVDGIFIGFNWITHPDLVKRIENGVQLNNIPDIPHLQTGKTRDSWAIGYTDYPIAVY